MQKLIWFVGGLLVGLTALSITKAAIPLQSQVTDDTSIYQRLSEIRIKKQKNLDFESDVDRLSLLEDRYHEALPSLKEAPRSKTSAVRVAQRKSSRRGKKSHQKVI